MEKLWNICVTNDHGYVPNKHFPVLSSFIAYHRVCSQINITGATSGAGSAYLPEHLRSPSVFSGVRVTRSLVLSVCFVDRCLSFCTFSFGHCVVYSSLDTDSDNPIWQLQTILEYYNNVPQTNFGRHIVFAPFPIILIIILLLLSFFSQKFVRHISATTEHKSMKLHRNVRCQTSNSTNQS